jgi:hypothetical protein
VAHTGSSLPRQVLPVYQMRERSVVRLARFRARPAMNPSKLLEDESPICHTAHVVKPKTMMVQPLIDLDRLRDEYDIEKEQKGS